ncbi:aromatic compound dioxygenase [Glonium stellatum]|uniref:Aromatic compound dioxygenase n=1 Tax=Glonium stellatum TaxID=574774 RepID=A0A8E2F8B3_9PEZI|nr:aromatic compound dioxygenase [Glonium stellatum]
MAGFSKILVVAAVYFLFIFTFTVAHPGEKHDKSAIAREMRARSALATDQHAQLSSCQNTEESRALRQRTMERRAATFQRLREEQGLTNVPFVERRNLAQFQQWEKTPHDRSKSLSYTTSTPEATVFGSNASCILAPDNANGPYFVFGEHIRSNLVEGQPGVPMHLEMQFIDTATCKPVTNILVDVWSCNATGAYSGVSAAGEGGLKTTFLRGVQQPDAMGVVSFDTIFPGHYSGRATHEHVITHVGATLNANGTYSGGHINHLSQLFFDQDLINAVEATAPYNTNKIARTSNDADYFTGYAATAAYDPFPNYVMLGNQLSQGIFAWVELGISLTNNVDQYATWAAYLAADGGHDNPNFNMWMVASPPSTHG